VPIVRVQDASKSETAGIGVLKKAFLKGPWYLKLRARPNYVSYFQRILYPLDGPIKDPHLTADKVPMRPRPVILGL
jgi:hypothetical protein